MHGDVRPINPLTLKSLDTTAVLERRETLLVSWVARVAIANPHTLALFCTRVEILVKVAKKKLLNRSNSHFFGPTDTCKCGGKMPILKLS